MMITLKILSSLAMSYTLTVKEEEKGLQHDSDKKEANIQLSKFKSHNLDVISFYRSKRCHLKKTE